MMTCPSCSIRQASRSCPVLQLELCGICCAERRRAGEECRADCRHYVPQASSGARHFRTAIRRHGAWLSARLRAFSGSEDAFAAALDLEESICSLAAEIPGLTDEEVLSALDHLARVAEGGAGESPSGELGLWLEECLQAAWDQDRSEEVLPGLLLLGIFESQQQIEVIRKVREIVLAEVSRGGYLDPASSYFEDLRSAEGHLGRRSFGLDREEEAGLGLAE